MDVAKIGGKMPEGFMISKGPDGEVANAITVLAVTKASTEQTLLRAMMLTSQELAKITDEAAWRKIAQMHAADAVLDSRSIALIKRQNPSLSEKQLAAMLQKFQESIALDTVRNEYLMHALLYPWLIGDPSRTNLEKFNEKVYAQLFHTPQSDPWLGLLPKDVYVGIDNGGVK
jgi:hypothetical protein